MNKLLTKTHKVMKRQLTIGLMLAAAFTLTNCSEQLVSPDLENDIIVDETIENDTPQGEDVRIPYEVLVNEPTTKTISDGEKIYWVDESTAVANGMGKQGTDKVNIFSTLADGSYKSHGVFVYAGDKRFVGELAGNLGATNNWYCLYPYGENNKVSGTGIDATVTIGATQESGYIQTQLAADSKSHIAGTACPMYHYLEGQSGTATPQFTMKHLSALLAINIVNEGGEGDILVNSAEVNFQTEVVGEFDVKIKGNDVTYTPVSGKASKNAVLSLGGATFTVAPGESLKLYMAVKPCVINAGEKAFTVKINGSSKQITLDKDLTFAKGSMTTLNVPLKLNAPTESNVFDLEGGSGWSKYKLASLIGDYTSTETMVINGHEVEVSVLGTPAKPGQVQITGTPKELINKVPITFYASSYGNNQGVMRVESISANIIIDFTFDYNRLITMMSPERITFSGVLPLEQYKRNGVTYITIMDENPILKEISKDNIEELLSRFDDNANDGRTPTFEGLLEAINNPDAIGQKDAEGNDTPATITAQCVYNKIEPILKDKASDLWGVASIFIGSPQKLFSFIDDTKVTVVLSTVDKNESDRDKATDNRVMAWGIHAGE